MRFRVFSPKPLGPAVSPTPLFVFISSSEEEFRELRKELRSAIDSEYLYNEKRTDDEQELVRQGNITRAILVEEESDESFDVSMKRGLGKSQLYVGIFGQEFSLATTKEYRVARGQGLPLLIYFYTEPPNSGKDMKTKTVRFLNAEVKPFVRIGGNYRRIVARDSRDLIDLILADIARKSTDLVREAILLRRLLIEESPDDTLAAILRARRSVFQ